MLQKSSFEDSPNPVLTSTVDLLDDLEHVQINDSAIREVADKWALDDWYIPDWNFSSHLKGTDARAVEYLILANTINFAYVDFETKRRFATEFRGSQFTGAEAMYVALQRAVEKQGDHVLYGKFLRLVTRQQVAEIFAGNPPMPLIDKRTEVWNEVGRVLCDKYDGRLINIVEASNGRLFDHGNGFVERLAADFSTFDDSVEFKGQRRIFNKRAQLAAGELRGRCQNKSDSAFCVSEDDVNEMTLYADYLIPWVLEEPEPGMDGVLKLSDNFRKKVQKGHLFSHADEEIIEMRTATVHAGDRIKNAINEIRESAGLPPISAALHLDPKLWFLGRKKYECEEETGQIPRHPLVDTIFF